MVIGLLLSGCLSPADFTEAPSNQSSAEPIVLFPDYVYDQEAARYSSGTHAVLSEDGYYLAINNALYFYDIQSDMLFPLCTKESCRHRDETCDAGLFNRFGSSDGENYVNGWASNAVGYKFYYYQEHLYTIGVHPDKGTVLFQYNQSFTEQKRIVWLEDYEKDPYARCIYQSLFFFDGDLFYMTWLYNEDKVHELEYETVYTAWKVSLEETAEPEVLFTFSNVNTAAAHIAAADGEIYFIIESETTKTIPENERESGAVPFQVSGGSGKVFRYQEKDGAELIWSYTGDQAVSLFEAEGALPRNMNVNEWLVNSDGDYVYFAGFPEYYDNNLMPTSVAVVNLKTREGRTLYKTPYRYIEQLRSDGIHYYFIEYADGTTYLTAIDREGDLVRRFELPLDETFIKNMEDSKLPREEWPTGCLRLLITDGRYITLGAHDAEMYKNLTSWEDVNPFLQSSVDNGIGVINTEDFLNGKSVEIRQIYKRTDPFN